MANLILAPENFSSAVNWNATNVGVSVDQILAPDNTLTADKIFANAVTNTDFRYEHNLTISGAVQCIGSCFFKAGEYDYAYIELSRTGFAGGVTILVDLVNGAIIDTDGGTTVSIDASGVEDYGNGWYRAYVVATATDATVGMRVGVSNSDSLNAGSIGVASYTGDGSSGIHPWGAVFEEGSTLNQYVSVGGTPVVPAGGGSLKRRTNLIQNLMRRVT